MITVYLAGGERAQLDNGVAVRKDPGANGGSVELVCLDSSGNEIGRFAYGSVAGYGITGLSGENKALITRLIDELVNKKRLHDLPEFFAPDFVEHVPTRETMQDIEAVKSTFETLHTAFPDAQFTIETMLAEGSLVAVRTAATTTHLGPLFGHPPTGRQVTIGNIDIYRMSGGKIVEHWGYGNDLGLAQELGLAPRILERTEHSDRAPVIGPPDAQAGVGAAPEIEPANR